LIGKSFFMRSALKPIAWLSLLLTLFAAYSFAAHQHSGSGDDAQCTICLVAHSAAPVAASNLPSALFILVLLIVLAEPVSANYRLVPFALTVRPPPVF
jgi:hypothetical protein